jgi:hypothetical protein
VAWAEPGQGQAVSGGFGSAHILTKPEPAQAEPKPRLLGQAGPEHHYTQVKKATKVGVKGHCTLRKVYQAKE